MKPQSHGFAWMVLACSLAGCSSHHTPAATTASVHTLLTQTLPENVGREVRMLTVDYPPGVSSAPHQHPGAVFVYVAQGSVQCALDNDPVRIYHEGESWSERPGQIHRVSANASDTEPAKLVVFFVTEPGKPVKEQVKP